MKLRRTSSLPASLSPPRHARSSSTSLGLAAMSAPLVVVRRRRDDRDVHAADAVDPVLVDLVEHRLLREAEGVVAPTVELLGRQAAEVADAREGDRHETVEELPHPVAAQ